MDTPKPFHPRHQVGLGRFDDQMEVIGHQTQCMHLPTGALTALPQDFNERLPIGIIMENRLAPVTPAHQMVKGTCILDAELARQGKSLVERPRLSIVTPFYHVATMATADCC